MHSITMNFQMESFSLTKLFTKNYGVGCVMYAGRFFLNSIFPVIFAGGTGKVLYDKMR
jgi:hypothetical protein